jgi:hypothetical protein
MLRGMIGHANGGGVTTSSLGRPRSVSAMPTGMTTGRTLFLPIAQTLWASTARGILMMSHTAMQRAKLEKGLRHDIGMWQMNGQTKPHKHTAYMPTGSSGRV